VFRRLVDHLEGGRACYGLQLPGLDGVSQPRDQIGAIAADFVGQIRRLQSSGPYHLIGYSFGGLVAYEMACLLTESGDEVGLVGLLDTPGPNALRRRPLWQRLRVHGARLARLSLAGRMQYLRGVTVRAAQRWLGHEAELLRGADRGAGPPSEFVRTLSVVRAAKKEAKRGYRARPFSGRVCLFRTEPEEWMQLHVVDPHYGWGMLCAGGVEVRPIPGFHRTLLEEPHAQDLARAIDAALAAGNP
jgi:thioesterase domain-containing protein